MYRKPKKIPTIVALLILVMGIGGGIFLIENRTSTKPQADVSLQPQSVQITNLTDSSFSVVWLSSKPTTGGVTYREKQSNEKIVVLDDRDTNSESKKYLTHHATVRNLNPQNSYSFQILVEGKPFNDLNGKEYTINTTAKPDIISELEPSYGEVVTAEDLPAEGAIVIVNMPRSLPLSTLVKASGNWLIPLNIARTTDLGVYTSTPPIIISISVYNSAESTGWAKAITDTDNDAPVPAIKLGKSYNFRAENNDEADSANLAAKPETLGSASVQSQATSFTVLQPVEKDSFVSTKPLFRGTGIAKSQVTIEIVSPKKLSGKTTVSDNGIWTWISPAELLPNSYAAKFTSLDKDGKSVLIERSFLIFKSGTQVLGEATPSASITVSPTVSLTLVPTAVVGAVSTPSATMRPTSTPIASVSSVPVSGNNDLTVMIAGMGMVLVLGGLYKCLFLDGYT